MKSSAKYNLAVINPKLAEEWHLQKNQKITPYDVTPGSNKAVWWVCSINKNHEWKAIINSRNFGNGCPFCGGKKVTVETSLYSINQKLAKEWYQLKNKNITPKDVMPNSSKKVWWQCRKNKNHIWQASISSRNSGKGCPYCSGRKASYENSLQSINPKLCNEWYQNKNIKITPKDVMPNSNKKVWWKCKKNIKHKWQATINSRNNGAGCPFCSGNKVSEDNCLQTVNLRVAKEWHPTKNGTLTPRDVIAGSKMRVWWQCKKNKDHIWRTSIGDRKITGCPFCHSQTSMIELSIYSEIKHIFRRTQNRKVKFGVECDIFIPEINMAIEIDGSYWHKNKLENDQRKNEILMANGMKILRIREKGLEKILKNDLLYYKKIADFELIKNILRIILKESELSKTSRNRINEYISGSKCINQDYYYKLQSMLPSPFPGDSLFDKNKRLIKEWHPTKNGNLTPKDVTENSGKKVWWICSNNSNHVWEREVAGRNAGSGCPYCWGSKVSKDNCLMTVNPKLAGEWHPTENGKLTPWDVTKGSHKKVWWRCKLNTNHNWKATIYDRNGRGCPYCAGKKAADDNNLMILKPNLAKEWHKEMNKDLSPDKVTLGSNKKVWWHCKNEKSHIWKAMIINRAKKGSGCPFCWKIKKASKNYSST
ncbi:MAG: zinc-ribbon domain-containing protein [Candidatus Omnitrophica bacterium]|nr:zinc-ribbon domain-containing protein [Candidatus Omnitrophota bacterium]